MTLLVGVKCVFVILIGANKWRKQQHEIVVFYT